MKNRMLNYLNSDRTGATTFEWSMLSGFTFALVFICFYFMLLLFSWVSYSSLAANIAQDINFRQTGWSKFNTTQVISTDVRVISNFNNSTNKHQRVYLRDMAAANSNVVRATVGDEGKGYSNNTKARNALIYSINKNSGQFLFPYTNFQSIKMNVARPDGSSPNLNSTSSHRANDYASCIVTVTIRYGFMPFGIYGDFGFPGVNMTASGYGVMT